MNARALQEEGTTMTEQRSPYCVHDALPISGANGWVRVERTERRAEEVLRP
jgi:hypothetical protein